MSLTPAELAPARDESHEAPYQDDLGLTKRSVAALDGAITAVAQAGTEPSQPPDAEMIKRLEALGRSLLNKSSEASGNTQPVLPGVGPATAPGVPVAPMPGAPGAPAAPAAPSAATPALPASMPAPPAPPRQPRSEIKRSPGEGDDQLTIHIQDSDLRDVLEMLSEQGGLNILASNSVQGKVSASLNGVDIDTALKAILKSTGYIAHREGKFIYVGNPLDFQNMEQTADRICTRIYRPNYVKASELQALIQPLLTPAGVGVASVTTASQSGIASDGSAAGGDAYAGNEAVLVRDYGAVLEQIDQVFQEIDQRPMQVAIEAMILSVKLDDNNNLGVDFLLLRDQNNARLATGSPLTDLGDLSFTDGGLKFGFLDSSLGAFINALESIGDTNVIATPRLMCLNKHRAEILIGAQLGYISTTLTETSAAQNVEFLEVGTQLRLRPFISSDGLIRMEVHPELSTGTVRVEQGLTLPDKEVTQVTSNIMVRDGCTVIIGGLMREDQEDATTRVPFLGSAPGIGWLFSSTKQTTSRRELIVLITPHIVYEPESCQEGDKAACEFHRRQEAYTEQMNPLGARHIGKRYFRLAQKAWTLNDRAAAEKFIHLSVHFDPMNRAALDLQSDICAGVHHGDHSSPEAAAQVIPEHPLDGDQISNWVLDDLGNAEPPAVHPRDTGHTGRSRDVERPRHFED